MHCPKCGIVMLEDEFTCSNCGYLMDIAIAANLVETESNIYIIPYYAGFWRRFSAQILDLTFLVAGELMVLMIIYGAIVLITMITKIAVPFRLVWPFFGGFGIILLIVVHWFYFTIMESSSKQATFGKQILKIVVTDLKEKPISLSKANLRYFSKLISTIVLFSGFIIAGVTSRKQTLHDKLAGTLVLNKNRN